MKSNATQTFAEKVSTIEPVFMSSKPQVINNQFYGTNTDDNSLYDDTKFEVSNEAVVVSSPAYGDKISSSYYTTEETSKNTQHGASHSQGYSTELPTRIYSSTATTSSEEANDLPNSIQFSQLPYDHSDIAYSPSDAEIFMDDNNNLISQYPSSTPETLVSETRTTEKYKFTKPIFKLKPTQYPSSTEKYVLVHTISNDKQSEGNQENPTKKPSTNESIQSILLMLNGSNPGPEYNVDTANDNNNYNAGASTTQSYGSTSMINREKYGSSSYYITTKVPSNRPTTLNVPSTSYVYSPNPTRRQTTSKTTTSTKNANRVKITPTRSPQRPTTLNVPSTSYVYSPNPITKRRPAATASSTVSSTNAIKKETANLIKKTTPKPVIIVKQPSPGDVENNYVVISGGGITKHPSPTVHITPKPITNILTSSTMNQINTKQTKRPPGVKFPTPSTPSASVTERPPFFSSTPATFISSSIYVPAIQDFHNEGYFVVTHRPAVGASSTAVYSINTGTLNSHPLTGTHVNVPGGIANDPVNFNDDVPPMNDDDLSNFPPVRNPNLNMTASNAVMDESEISTPSFMEDEQLNSKIDLLVNKLVASMHGNLDNLIDIVYERKNVSTAEQDIANLNKNGTHLQNSKPTKPSTNLKATTTVKTATRVTTGRPSSQTKPPSKATTTTKKPTTANKRPTQKPAASSQTTTRKPPARVTTTTKKPLRKVTTTSTTERAPLEDEVIDEDNEGEGETAEEEETDEDNIVDESESEAPSSPVENGKIRKKLVNKARSKMEK